MRIAVVHRYPLSLAIGTNPALPYFLDELARRSHDVTFVSYRDVSERAPRTAVQQRAIPVTFDRGRSRDRLIKSLLFTLLAPFWLWRLGRHRFDVIYCDDSFPLYGFITRLITGSPTFIRLGDLQTAYAFAGHAGSAPLRFRVIQWLERLTWKPLDLLIVISRALECYVVAHGIRPERVAVVPECLDPGMFDAPAPIGLRARLGWGTNPIVMFHGIVAPMKGLDALIHAVPLILSKVPSARFVVIGDGPDLQRLRDLAAAAGVDDRIVFTGWVPLDEIPGHLAECDLGVPCRSPNLGNDFVVTTALLQYWAVGRPVVAPATASVREVIAPGENGWLFRPGDADDLADRIVDALERPEARRAAGEAGRQTLQRTYLARDVACRLADAIEHACGVGGPATPPPAGGS